MSGILFKNMPSQTTSQGANSATFHCPPDKESIITVAQLYDWHSIHSKDHPFFEYFDEASNTKVTVRWGQAARAVHFIANSVLAKVRERSLNDETKPLVGLYSSSDTLGYILSFVGIMRAGFPVFLISNRAAPASLRHLIAKSGVSHIFVSDHDDALSRNLQDAKEAIGVDFNVARIPPWFDVISKDSDILVEIPPFIKPDPDSLCLILHSSGSTALPELNLWTHKMVLPALWQPWYGDRDLCGQVMSTPSIPMAGASGVMQALFTASSGIVISGLKPTSPPTAPNPQNVWTSMASTGSNYGFVLQPFLAIWSEDVDKIKSLAGLDGVMFGGGPLPRAVGDKLAKSGVEIFTFFGSSEAGLMSRTFPRKMGVDWEWFSFYSAMSPVFRPEPDDKTVELILKRTLIHQPTRINTEVDGVPAYATGDLLEPHPTEPGLWRYVCRVSDQETMGGGPKVNVVAFARLFMQDPLITGAVLFSHTIGHSVVCGVIVEPHRNHDERNDLDSLDAYKDSIWPTIQRYNDLTFESSRVTKERIIVASIDKPFTYGEKGMPRRKEVIAIYHDEIQRLA